MLPPPPPPCSSDADCVAGCPGDACVCTTTLEDMQVCAPTCALDADCPQGFHCLDSICRPPRADRWPERVLDLGSDAAPVLERGLLRDLVESTRVSARLVAPAAPTP